MDGAMTASPSCRCREPQSRCLGLHVGLTTRSVRRIGRSLALSERSLESSLWVADAIGSTNSVRILAQTRRHLAYPS